MSEKIKKKGETKVDLDRELVECSAGLVECKLKLAEHNHRLAYHEKENKLTSCYGATIDAELVIFSLGLLFGVEFSLADRVVDSLYYGGGNEVTTTQMEQNK